MRKLFSFALAVCMALLLSVPAFADGRGPAFTTYDVVCTKDTPYFREDWENDGVMEKKGTFPAGTTLTVEYEYEKDGVVYGDVQVGEDENAEWMYIRLSDTEMKDDTYLPENAQKLSRAHAVRVTEKGGIPLYAGPNKRFAKIATIPRSTKLTYTYGNDDDDYYRTWAYVSYLGKRGWIYVYATDTKNGVVELPDKDTNAEIWALEDGVKMFSGISFGNIENDELDSEADADIIRELHEEPDRVVGTLEKGKKYSYRYSHLQNYGTWYYVTAGLRSGWVFVSNETSPVATATTAANQDRYMAFRPFTLKLLEAPDKNAKSTAVSIAAGTVLSSDYIVSIDYEEFFYTTIGGQSGWYARENLLDDCAYKIDPAYHGHYSKNESKKTALIYADAIDRSKTVGKIPAGALFTPLYYGDFETKIDEENSEWTFFYYARYNDVTGWVTERDLWTPDDAEEDETALEEETEEYSEAETEEAPDVAEPGDDESETAQADDGTVYAPKSGLGPLQIVLVCVGGAVVLALTAAVTLVLLRRKRGNKAAAPAEEPQTEPAETEAEPADETDEPS